MSQQETNKANYEMITNALVYLSSVCDGAAQLDHQGFNGVDSQFGKSLARQIQDGHTLTIKQQTAAWKMIKKYRNQLHRAGYELPNSFDQVYIPGANPAPVQEKNPYRLGLLKSGRIGIAFPAYNNPKFSKVLTAVKSVPGRKFHNDGPKAKYWSIPESSIVELMEAFRKMGDLVGLFDIPQPVQDILRAQLDLQEERAQLALKRNITEPTEQLDLPTATNGDQLFPFQAAGVEFAQQAKGRAIIADDMGLGKTVQAIGYMALNPEQTPVIIVCPSSVKLNWQKEIVKWLPQLENKITVVKGKKPYDLAPHNIVIINYDILSDWVDYLVLSSPALVIFDEGHYIKNAKAKRSKAAKKLGKKAKSILALTGTPITNRTRELFPLLNLVAPDVWYSFWNFAHRYCNAHHNGYGWDFDGASNLDELFQVTAPYMIRRTKAQVLPDLPPKTMTPILLNDIKLSKDYEQYLREAMSLSSSNTAQQLVFIEKAKQAAARAKMKSVKDWILDFLQITDEKICLFTTHKDILQELCIEFKEWGVVKIDGSTPMDSRQAAVDKFQNDPAYRVFVGNIKAAGEGITLTAASNEMIVEYPWTPGALNQVIDRIYRISQESKVNIYMPVAAGTIEEDIVDLLNYKQSIIDQAIDGYSRETRSSGDGWESVEREELIQLNNASILDELMIRIREKYENK